jgi:hypothetical protein
MRQATKFQSVLDIMDISEIETLEETRRRLKTSTEGNLKIQSQIHLPNDQLIHIYNPLKCFQAHSESKSWFRSFWINSKRAPLHNWWHFDFCSCTNLNRCHGVIFGRCYVRIFVDKITPRTSPICHIRSTHSLRRNQCASTALISKFTFTTSLRLHLSSTKFKFQF